jgi:hypothetical protein
VGLPPSPVKFSSHCCFYKFSHSWLLGMCCCSWRLPCLFIAPVRGGSSPLFCAVFLPLPLSQAFWLLVAGRMPLLLPSLDRPSLFIYSSRRDSPHPLFVAQGTPPTLLCMFIFLIAYYSVSLFFPGWGLICPGGYADLAQGCLWKYCIPLSSPCPCLPKPSEHGHLVARGHSWFLHLMWSGDSLRRLEMWRVKVLSLLGGFACKVCLQHLSKISQ